MKLLSRLFRRSSGDSDESHRWSLTPLEAKVRAKWIIKSAAGYGVELDYSPESLTKVDMLIDKERETGVGLTKEMAVVMLSLGAYVGEVMVRHLDAAWVYGAKDQAQDPLLVLVDKKYAINVVSIVFRRFILGEPNSAAVMFEETKKLVE